jgi:maltooligosyltrehalose trehalohydrolase
MPTTLQRRLPVGAEVSQEGAHFRVWAPRCKRAAIVLEHGGSFALDPEPGGYFSGLVTSARNGTLYRFSLDGSGMLYPDPASRFQPLGPHGPSQIVDSSLFQWSDSSWEGIRIQGQIIYEMHIGTFTPQGTWRAARAHIGELSDLGISLIELMPVADFPGAFGWGYDGVNWFAPTRLYGTPDDLRAFVDAAHAHGLGVILDVVYNHFGPDGNYLKHFSSEYFTARYGNEWGDAINFDGPGSGPVREFVTSNACYWITEFHLDGLRLDATQQMYDSSPEHIIAEIVRRSRVCAGRRHIVLIGENEAQQAKLALPAGQGGYGLDALWNDDYHHSWRVALTGRNEAYYSDYQGSPQELISSGKWGFLYQGQYYSWQKKKRGTAAFDLKAAAFVNYIQNHDQVANSARGERLSLLTSPGRLRAATLVLLLLPGTPMLFQGQEFGSLRPFLYFADHYPDLASSVQAGRAAFLDQFPSIREAGTHFVPGRPHDREVFECAKLDQHERQSHVEMLALHRDCIRLRREDEVFRQQRSDWMHGAVLGPEAFVLRFFGGDHGDRLILANLGRDLNLFPAPEPLLGSREHMSWARLLSSDDPRYGGSSRSPVNRQGIWNIPGHSAVVMYETPD